MPRLRPQPETLVSVCYLPESPGPGPPYLFPNETANRLAQIHKLLHIAVDQRVKVRELFRQRWRGCCLGRSRRRWGRFLGFGGRGRRRSPLRGGLPLAIVVEFPDSRALKGHGHVLEAGSGCFQPDRRCTSARLSGPGFTTLEDLPLYEGGHVMHIISRRHLAGDCRPRRPDNLFAMNVEAAVWLMRAWGGLSLEESS